MLLLPLKNSFQVITEPVPSSIQCLLSTWGEETECSENRSSLKANWKDVFEKIFWVLRKKWFLVTKMFATVAERRVAECSPTNSTKQRCTISKELYLSLDLKANQPKPSCANFLVNVCSFEDILRLKIGKCMWCDRDMMNFDKILFGMYPFQFAQPISIYSSGLCLLVLTAQNAWKFCQ